MLSLNNHVKKTPLTIEKIKKTSGLENISDEEAQEIIDSLAKFARICIQYHNAQTKSKEHLS